MSLSTEHQQILTKSDCQQIAERALKSSKCEVSGFRIEEIPAETKGFLAEYFLLEIDLIDGQTLKFFVKSIPRKDEFMKKTVEEIGVFEKESALYQDLFGRFPERSHNDRWHADCFLVQNGCVVLEDLTLKSYQIAPDNLQLSNVHVKETLRTLARMHSDAITFEAQNHTRIDLILGDLTKEVNWVRDSEWFQELLKETAKVILERTELSKIPENRDYLEKNLLNQMMDSLDSIQNVPAEFTKILCQKDIWNNNLFFKFGETSAGQVDYSKPLHCILVDFQCIAYHPAAVDVVFALLMLVGRDERERYFEENLDFYYSTLNEELEKRNVPTYMTRESFKRSVEYFWFLGLTIKAGIFSQQQIPKEVMVELRVDKHKWAVFNREGRSQIIIDVLDRYEDYRKTVEETLEDLVKYILKTKK